MITSIIVFIYSFTTVNRNRDWKDNFTLFSHDIKFMPNNARAHCFLGNEIIRTIATNEGDRSRFIEMNWNGISELKKSIDIYPNNIEALNCLGAGYMQIDSFNKAEYYFDKALKLNSNDFSYKAGLSLAKGDYANAILLYDKILKKNPNNLDALVYSGIAYGAVKKYKDAIECFNKAISIQPASSKVLYYLSSSYKYSGDSINSEKYYREAYALDPSLPRP